MTPLLMIEAPRMLFPFAREILAKATHDGGYPPVMLNPIDFLAVFREQMKRRDAESGSAASSSACTGLRLSSLPLCGGRIVCSC